MPSDFDRSIAPHLMCVLLGLAPSSICKDETAPSARYPSSVISRDDNADHFQELPHPSWIWPASRPTDSDPVTLHPWPVTPGSLEYYVPKAFYPMCGLLATAWVRMTQAPPLIPFRPKRARPVRTRYSSAVT